MRTELERLLLWAKVCVQSLSAQERTEMLRKQAEGWAKSEAQWAKDYAEGKCERD